MNRSVRILGIPVTLEPTVLLGLAVLGLVSRLDGAVLVAWIGLGFVALLLHELGHAVVFRRFGVSSRVSFFLLGGITTPDDVAAATALPDARQLAVALAGPAASLVVGLLSLGAVLLAANAGATTSHDVGALVFLWLFVNLGWAIFNLLPIGNLDGGRAVRHLLGALVPGRAGVILGVSADLVASGLIAALALGHGLVYVAFVAVVFGLASPDLWSRLRDAVMPPTPGPATGPGISPDPDPTPPDDQPGGGPHG